MSFRLVARKLFDKKKVWIHDRPQGAEQARHPKLAGCPLECDIIESYFNKPGWQCRIITRFKKAALPYLGLLK